MPTAKEATPEQLEKVKTFIKEHNGIHEGDTCPICEKGKFKREPMLKLSRSRISVDFHLLKCPCGYAIRDIWTKEGESK